MTLPHFCFSGNSKTRTSPFLGIVLTAEGIHRHGLESRQSFSYFLSPPHHHHHVCYLPLQNKTGSKLQIKTLLESLHIFLRTLLRKEERHNWHQVAGRSMLQPAPELMTLLQDQKEASLRLIKVSFN